MKCNYCNYDTIFYQINDNHHFPVCLNHLSFKYDGVGVLPSYIPKEQGLKYLKRKQIKSWIESC